MTSPSATAWTLPAIVPALRDATRAAHERLDASNPIAAPALDLRAYHAILGRYVAAHAAVELALEPWTKELAVAGVSLDERRKMPLLRRDRAVTRALLGEPADEPRDAVRFAVPTLPSAWGALYVVEGSTLGGQHILRTLETSDMARRSALKVEGGLSYFHGYGRATGEMWRQFLLALGGADAADASARAEIIDGAESTFALFERILVAPRGAQVNTAPVDERTG